MIEINGIELFYKSNIDSKIERQYLIFYHLKGANSRVGY